MPSIFMCAFLQVNGQSVSSKSYSALCKRLKNNDKLDIFVMVLISDGNLEHVAHVWRKVSLFWKKIRLLIALDLIICLKQIKWQRLPITCAPIIELPSNIVTMISVRRIDIFLHFTDTSRPGKQKHFSSREEKSRKSLHKTQ